MTTVILTTIGILLAAATALMITFYGGDLFSSGTTGASANGYMNAGANVVAAIDNYRINERSDPASIDVLVAAGYFKPDGIPGTMSLTRGTPGRFTIADVPADICSKINETLGRTAAEASAGAGVSGCQDGVFYQLT